MILATCSEEPVVVEMQAVSVVFVYLVKAAVLPLLLMVFLRVTILILIMWPMKWDINWAPIILSP